MNKLKLILILIILTAFGSVNIAHAYWVWTPQTKKWVNPKYAPKPTPKEQLEYALSFFNAGTYKDAEREFRTLLRTYPKSAEAAEAQYYLGKTYENTNRFYEAFLAYQKVIDIYPFSQRIQEVNEIEFKIAERFLSGEKRKIAGVPLPVENPAIEIFQKIIDNSEYGPLAPIAQYKLGLVLKGLGRFSEAQEAFEKVVSKYPSSEWVDAAKFQIASSRAGQSQGPDYDQDAMQEAKQKFEEFIREHPDAQLSKEAEKNINELKMKEAASNFSIAAFYEKQKAYGAAKIYYEQVAKDYSDSPFAAKAQAKVDEFQRLGLDKITDPKELKKLKVQQKKEEAVAKKQQAKELKQGKIQKKIEAKQQALDKKKEDKQEKLSKKQAKIDEAKKARAEKLAKEQESKNAKLQAKQAKIEQARIAKELKLKQAQEAKQKALDEKQRKIEVAKAKKAEKIMKAQEEKERKLQEKQKKKEKKEPVEAPTVETNPAAAANDALGNAIPTNTTSEVSK